MESDNGNIKIDFMFWKIFKNGLEYVKIVEEKIKSIYKVILWIGFVLKFVLDLIKEYVYWFYIIDDLEY